MKSKYTSEEQRDIRRWCEEAVDLYREYIQRHEHTDEAARARTLLDIHQALEVDTEEFTPKTTPYDTSGSRGEPETLA